MLEEVIEESILENKGQFFKEKKQFKNTVLRTKQKYIA